MLGSTPGAEPYIYISLSRIARILSDFKWTLHSRPVSLQRKSARAHTGTRVHQTLVALCMSATIHSVALLLNARAASPATDMTAEWPTLEMMSKEVRSPRARVGGRRKAVFPLPSRPSRQSRGGSAVVVGAAIRNARSNTNDCRSEQLHRILLRFGRRRRPRTRIFMGCRECS